MITVFAIGLLMLVGCGTSEQAQPTNTPPPTETPPPPTNTPVPEVIGDAEAGRLVFENGGANEVTAEFPYLCAGCHTLDGSEGAREGPDLQGISQRASETVPGLSAAQYIHQSIMDPRAFVVDGYSYMSAAPSRLFSEEEIADLVAFLLTQ
jgi:mono/diheme cytochrome c family protein